MCDQNWHLQEEAIFYSIRFVWLHKQNNWCISFNSSTTSVCSQWQEMLVSPSWSCLCLPWTGWPEQERLPWPHTKAAPAAYTCRHQKATWEDNTTTCPTPRLLSVIVFASNMAPLSFCKHLRARVRFQANCQTRTKGRDKVRTTSHGRRTHMWILYMPWPRSASACGTPRVPALAASAWPNITAQSGSVVQYVHATFKSCVTHQGE